MSTLHYAASTPSVVVYLLVLATLSIIQHPTPCNSFHLSITTKTHSTPFHPLLKQQQRIKSSSLYVSTNDNKETTNNKKNIVVISPPGGIGQISAIESVKLGANVYWFIVSSPSTANENVKLSSSVYNNYKDSIQIAGSTYENAANQRSVDSILSWCENKEIDGLICTMDGIETKDIDEYNTWCSSIRGITQQMSAFTSTKVAITSLDDKLLGSKKSKLSGIVNLFKGGDADSLEEAIGDNENTVVLYHGDLFGVPDSSADASPFEGGPRRDPIVRDEYTMRLIRLDSIPVFDAEEDNSEYDDDVEELVTNLLKSLPRTSRLSIGEASAAYLVSSDSSSKQQRQELLLSSTRGLYPLSMQDWNNEFAKVITTTTATTPSKDQGGVYSIQFGSIPSAKRLFDWLETKWAPAILRSYDIAGIRVGVRPVSTKRTSENQLDILFQTLDTKTYQSTNIGKLLIMLQEDQTTIVVKREIIDRDFLEQSSKKRKKKYLFQGEDVLLRSLEDASNQAIDKKLATKAVVEKVEEEVPPPPPTPIVQQPVVVQSESGPKSKGARRSSERSRGTTSSSSSRRSSKSKKGQVKKDDTTSSNTTNEEDAFQ